MEEASGRRGDGGEVVGALYKKKKKKTLSMAGHLGPVLPGESLPCSVRGV